MSYLSPGQVTEVRGRVRSELYGSAGSGASCFSWLQTLFRVMVKIIKLLKK